MSAFIITWHYRDEDTRYFDRILAFDTIDAVSRFDPGVGEIVEQVEVV